MPNFPRFTSTTTPRGSGLARAQDIGALTRTSDQEFYRSLGAVSQGLNVAAEYAFRANQDRRAIDADLQHKKAAADVFEFNEGYKRSMKDASVESDDQRREYHQNYLKELEIINRQRNEEIDNEDALNARKSDWPNEKLVYSKNMYSYLTGKLHHYQKGTVWQIGESLIKDVRIDEAKQHLQYHVSRGLISQADVDSFIAEKETYYEARKILAEKGYDAADDFVMSKDIDTDIKKKIISDINFEASQQEIERKRQLEQKETEYLLAMTKEQLSQDTLDNDLAAGIITPDIYKEYANYITAQQRERLKGRSETDWNTWSALRDMVQDYEPETQSKDSKDAVKDEISKAVKEGKITFAEGMSLREKLYKKEDPDNPLNRPSVKRGFETLTELKALRKSILKDEDEVVMRDEIIRMRGIEYDFEQWLKEEERTDEEIEKKIKHMTAPIQEKITLNWFERLMAGLNPAEAEALVKKKMKVLKEKGVWDKLSEAEQNDVKVGFEKGASVQDVLDLMNAD